MKIQIKSDIKGLKTIPLTLVMFIIHTHIGQDKESSIPLYL